MLRVYVSADDLLLMEPVEYSWVISDAITPLVSAAYEREGPTTRAYPALPNAALLDRHVSRRAQLHPVADTLRVAQKNSHNQKMSTQVDWMRCAIAVPASRP